jgi:hypothetical protein
MGSELVVGTLPPAGWYPDPEDQQEFRWWDGTQWGQRAPHIGTALPAADTRAEDQPARGDAEAAAPVSPPRNMYAVTRTAEREDGSKVFVVRDPSDGYAPWFRVVRETTGELSFYWGELSQTYTGELREFLYLAVLRHEVPDAQFEINPDPYDPRPYTIDDPPGATHYMREHFAPEYAHLRTGHRADHSDDNQMSISSWGKQIARRAAGGFITKGAKRTIAAGTGMILIAIIGLNTTIIAGLQNTIEGTLDLSQSHALCNSTFGQAAQAISATGASNCSTINGWYSLCVALCWVGGIALALVAAHAFRLARQRQASFDN